MSECRSKNHDEEEDKKPAQERKELDPHLRCIKYSQLMKFDKAARRRFGRTYGRKTMRDMVEHVIEPQCQKSGTSYAEYLNPNGLRIETFVTHSWDEPFADFCESIRDTYQTALRKPHLWICAFALKQGDEQTIEEQMGSSDTSLDDSPFLIALLEAKSFVVVRNANTDLYTRIWCVCELIFAIKHGLVPDNTNVTGPDNFRYSRTSVQEAKATKQGDRDRIIDALINDHTIDEIDKIVKKFRTFGSPSTGHCCCCKSCVCRPYKDPYLLAAQLLSIVALCFSWVWPPFLALALPSMVIMQAVWCLKMKKCFFVAAGVFSIITALGCLFLGIWFLIQWKDKEWCIPFFLVTDDVHQHDYCLADRWAVIYFFGFAFWVSTACCVFYFLIGGRYETCINEMDNRDDTSIEMAVPTAAMTTGSTSPPISEVAASYVP